MKFYPQSIGLVGLLASVPDFAGIPDSPQQVQPLAVGARAPTFSARTTEGALRTFGPDSYKTRIVVQQSQGDRYPLHVAIGQSSGSGKDLSRCLSRG